MDITHISLRRHIEGLVLHGQQETEVFVNMRVFEDDSVLVLICKNVIRLMMFQVSILIMVTLFILVFISEHNFCYSVCQSACKALFDSDLIFFILAYWICCSRGFFIPAGLQLFSDSPRAPFWVLLWFAFVDFRWVNIIASQTLYCHILSDGTQLLLIL